MGIRGPKVGQYKVRFVPAGSPAVGASSPAPKFTPGAPTCPSWMSAEAKKAWKRVCRELETAGTIATVDVDLLTAYCSLVADLKSATQRINTDGVWVNVVVKDRHGAVIGEAVKPHALLKAKDAMTARLRQLSDSLQIGPAARTRQGSAGAEPEKRPNKVLALRDRIQGHRANASNGTAG